ncbi:sigma-54-dependent Fis family transcriptional regulator [Pseudaquabacterium pictum]|uniref:Sigma-54-dependent Fis family transcriptional regulator n=1 Tax=Pseudaquabacterium pictum TaxID=2315236 RepID=A0A480AH59_9BURK|nr:sigma-54-dependent Fis family transcriptional regulator [Rubrivivax pictus]GCL61099.1 sigma-54-dependent Fis family transcriptional regulator [Rubrivivax pictus]
MPLNCPPRPDTPRVNPHAQPCIATRLRDARRCLAAQADGPADDLLPALTPLLGEVLARSWQRSAQAGLAPQGRRHGAPHASAAQLARAMQRQYELLSHAQPVLDYMAQQVAGTPSLLILADAQGMLLRTQGDADVAGRAERVALRPGAHWAEAWRGTNAIGTALAQEAPVVVHGGQHYLERNGFLTCAAAPIIDPAGRLMGAFDISGEQRAHHPSSLGHTLGLARSAARMVEHRLFDTWHAGSLRLRLHPQAEGLGTLGEGLLAWSGEGLLIGANAAGLAALGLGRSAIGTLQLAQCLQTTLDSLLDWALQASRSSHTPPRVLHRLDGAPLWSRVQGGATMAPRRPAAADATPAIDAPPARSDALAALDTGDPAMAAAVQRARRVVDKPIALLLQGESGVGKEVFARAVHASGPRRAGPFVAVNCAALPETLIEAELFGYQGGAFTGARREGAPGRIREAHGGTLFLDEIGDMPLAMQARLLRVLQERTVVPLGGGKPVAVDFALMCATHRTLRSELDAGRFRADLYYRLNGLTLHLPPLRERGDLMGLVAQMLADIAPDRPLVLDAPLTQALAAYRWPGNLRQLHNALRTAVALLGDGELQIGWAQLPDDLAADLQAARARRPPEQLADEEADLRLQQAHSVARMVEVCHGNLSEAARRLGISRNTLYRKLGRASPG